MGETKMIKKQDLIRRTMQKQMQSPAHLDITKPHTESQHRFINDFKGKDNRKKARELILNHIALRKKELDWLNKNLIEHIKADIKLSEEVLRNQQSINTFRYRTTKLSEYLIKFLTGVENG